ncbi:hypothetical protein [Agromyces sp. Soil535]|uniref:hypothetical protein n=1 Tax=Agromyces sp. Soil535 TaxID=1736390 RepID=UPI0006FFCE32|nr:hypothetical protein [Agromyces sp. Soil535]KRE23632.1 hypothetical protein ASG80_08070 [Agromyces sp. Soil535]
MAERGTSASNEPGQTTGWFSRVPMWVRIAVPAVLLVGGAAAVVVAVSQPQDPIEAAQSVCHSGAQAELEFGDRSAIDVSRSFEVVAAGDDSYRVTGTATFQDTEGTTHHVNVRCIIRVEDGRMRAASIRVQD